MRSDIKQWRDATTICARIILHAKIMVMPVFISGRTDQVRYKNNTCILIGMHLLKDMAKCGKMIYNNYLSPGACRPGEYFKHAMR